MQIAHINDRLHQWADWVASGHNNGLGYPRQSPYTKLVRIPGQVSEPEFNDQAWEIDRAVRSLCDYLRKAVEVFYLHRGTVEQKARDANICPNTLYHRIDRAQEQILDWLKSYEAEKLKISSKILN